MSIKIIITGGTFDKEYNELNGELFFRDTHLPQMLKLGRSNLNIKVEFLMLIDSLFMNEEHREKIVVACKNSKEEKIVITHGTDTMVETAKYLSERIKNKTIILTGAMIPYAFGSSDGLFNLGAALAFSQTLEKGVCIAMNGKYFPCENVKKNKNTGKFEKILEE